MANDFSAFIPQWWANESLAILEENMVALGMVNRDFEPQFAQWGDVVNTRRPNEFTAVRKVTGDAVTVQNATATNVQVRLDQHVHVTFEVNDLEQRSSFKDLIDVYVRPAGLALARNADRVILGQYPRFITNSVGLLGQGSSGSGYMMRSLASMKVKLDTQKCYEDGRNIVLSPLTEGYFLGSPESYKVLEAGNAGERTNGQIGRIMGLQTWSAQNMSDVALNPAGLTKTVAVNAANGVLAGSTSVPTDGWAAGTDIAAGDWVTVGGFPTRVESVAGSYANTTTTMTLTTARAMPTFIADNTVVLAYKKAYVNNSGGYASGWNKAIAYDLNSTTGYAPAQAGQAVQIGSAVYTVVDWTSTTILLDRSLEASVADNDPIYCLPPGSYSLAVHRNAITAAVRPIQAVPDGLGAKSGTVSHNGLTVRATMGYDMTYQKTMVTLDFLMGVQVLDTNLGSVLLT